MDEMPSFQIILTFISFFFNSCVENSLQLREGEYLQTHGKSHQGLAIQTWMKHCPQVVHSLVRAMKNWGGVDTT